MPFDHEHLDVHQVALNYIVVASDVIEQLPRELIWPLDARPASGAATMVVTGGFESAMGVAGVVTTGGRAVFLLAAVPFLLASLSWPRARRRCQQGPPVKRPPREGAEGDSVGYCRARCPRIRTMPVESLKLKDFTAFREATLELAPGINVFIGENATGKTHAMKVAYAALRAMADRKTSPSRFDVLLRDSPENEHPV